MSEIKDGGPAFPVSLPGLGDNGATGMSLRDHFAGLAMQGMWAHPENCGLIDYQMAERAYQMADIMIMQRGKP